MKFIILLGLIVATFAATCPTGIWDAQTPITATHANWDHTAAEAALLTSKCARVIGDEAWVVNTAATGATVLHYKNDGTTPSTTVALPTTGGTQAMEQCAISPTGMFYFFGGNQFWNIASTSIAPTDVNASAIGAITLVADDAVIADTMHYAGNNKAAVSGKQGTLYVADHSAGTASVYRPRENLRPGSDETTRMALWDNRAVATLWRTNKNEPNGRIKRTGWATATAGANPGDTDAAWTEMFYDNDAGHDINYAARLPAASSGAVALWGPTTGAATFRQMAWQQSSLSTWASRNCDFGSRNTSYPIYADGIGPYTVLVADAAPGATFTEQDYHLSSTVPERAAGVTLLGGMLAAMLAVLI